jgi:hypothetical protein
MRDNREGFYSGECLRFDGTITDRKMIVENSINTDLRGDYCWVHRLDRERLSIRQRKTGFENPPLCHSVLIITDFFSRKNTMVCCFSLNLRLNYLFILNLFLESCVILSISKLIYYWIIFLGYACDVIHEHISRDILGLKMSRDDLLMGNCLIWW